MYEPYVVAGVYGLAGFVNAAKIIFVNRCIRRLREEIELRMNEADFSQIIVLVPALQEQDVIIQLLSDIEKIDYPADKIRIFVITAEKERGERTTAAVVDHYLASYSGRVRIERTHYPLAIGCKSDQLNYCLEKLDNEGVIELDALVAVYDADSKIIGEAFRSAAVLARLKPHCDVFQQPSLYLKNWQELPLLGKSFALMQTAFAFYYETYNFLSWNSGIPRMRYCIGHGLFVRWSFFQKIGYFPTPIEDTRLGHIVSYLGGEIGVIPIFDACNVTRRASSRIRQAAVWFQGEAMFRQSFKIASSTGHIPFVRNMWLSAYKIWRNAYWIFKGPLFLMVIILVGMSYPFLVPIVLCYLAIPTLVVSVSRKKFTESILALVVAPAEFILMSIGPIFGLALFMRARLFRSAYVLSKTER